MFRTSLLLVSFFFASYDCAAVPDAGDTGRTGGLRDWMRGMKERMSNRESSGRMGLMGGGLDMVSRMKLPPAVVSMMTGERMFQPVNLANVKFDPTSDRAYRMGNWYMIRRRSTNNSNKDDEADDWSEFFDRKDDRWEVVNNGVERCGIPELTGNKPAKKESAEEELLAEVLNPTTM